MVCQFTEEFVLWASVEVLTLCRPLSTNNTLNEQYYYVQRADGSRILAVVSLNQGVSNTTAQQSSTTTVTTMAGSQ